METIAHCVDYMLPLFEVWKANELSSLDFFWCFTLSFSNMYSRSVIRYGFN